MVKDYELVNPIIPRLSPVAAHKINPSNRTLFLPLLLIICPDKRAHIINAMEIPIFIKHLIYRFVESLNSCDVE